MTADSPWIVETTQATFEKDVIDRSHELPVVVDFWAEWCQPCRILGPVLEKLAREYEGKFVLVKADTEQVPTVAAEFQVQSIPAVYVLRDGQIVDGFMGALPEPQLRQWLSGILPSEAEELVASARTLLDSDPSQAEAKLRKATEIDSNDHRAKTLLAELLLALDRLDECQSIIDELELRGHLEPEVERVKSALSSRLRGEAVGDVDACRAAVANSPDDHQLQLNLADALAAAQQFEEALQVNLSVVQKDQGEYREKARQAMVDLFRLMPEDSELTSEYRRKLSMALF